jgi:hypothetical protein
MSAQHTPGRLSYRENGDANSYTLQTDGEWLISLLHNGQPLAEKQRENMRRLVACWNACEPIADPENVVPRLLMSNERVPELESQVASLIAQRDELLEALNGVAMMARCGQLDQFVREPWLCAVFSSIAKAEGGAA